MGVKPSGERQARPLTKLETPEQQQEAWTTAVDASGGKPTGEHTLLALPGRALSGSLCYSSMKPLYHYTTFSRLRKILESKMILPATAGVTGPEKPSVWLTYNELWSPTGTPMVRDESLPNGVRPLTFEELPSIDSPTRIQVMDGPKRLRWVEWVTKSGCDKRMSDALQMTAKQKGEDVREWRMSFLTIPLEEWLAIEIYVNGKWDDAAIHFPPSE